MSSPEHTSNCIAGYGFPPECKPRYREKPEELVKAKFAKAKEEERFPGVSSAWKYNPRTNNYDLVEELTAKSEPQDNSRLPKQEASLAPEGRPVIAEGLIASRQ